MEQRNNKRGLARTPRTNDTIVEYFEKFGQNRDLEKFMRIYSPASSQDSQSRHARGSHETISSTSSCEALAKMHSRPLSNICCGANSKSMPNIDVHEKEHHLKDGCVDINIEIEEDKIFSASSENLQTPKKGDIVDVKLTKTPDSIAKTHRRLEWDSLGDIGYRKSMSTSNISVLERSLLKEFFKEGSVTSEPSKCQREDDEAILNTHEEPHKQLRAVKVNNEHVATPPLACSTLVEGLSSKATVRGARPKMISQSTSSTSLQKKFEKYAQTTLVKPTCTHSQEIQVSMSSSTSVVEGTATPSSFEYYSSRSSKSRSSRSSGGISSNLSNTNIPTANHPFITSITDLLRKRKDLNNRALEKQTETIKRLQTKFQTALEENKENQSHTNTASSTATTSFSLTRQAPELDLGIQLICSLIDAKSVNGKQKKKLIRDIVKRITRLGDEYLEEHTNSISSDISNVYDVVYSRSRKEPHTRKHAQQEKKLTEKLEKSDLGLTSIKMLGSTCEQLGNIPVHATTSKETCQQTKTTKNNNHLHILGNSNRQSNKSNNKQLPQSSVINVDHNKVPIITTAAADKPNNEVQSECNTMEKSSSNENQLQNIKTTRSTQTTNSSGSTRSKRLHLTSSTRTTSSGKTTTSCTSSSNDLPTQKTLRKNIVNEDMDGVDGGDQSTMREWLNPLTQSEIEYEEKKREGKGEKVAKASPLKRDKDTKKLKQSKDISSTDRNRDLQLNWIEKEIHRLESLKHLLLKDGHNKSPPTTVSQSHTEESCNRIKDSCNSTHGNKLYDTVYSDTSSVLSESAERLVKEIEVILEESSEDITHLNDNTTRTRERNKETQILVEGFRRKPKSSTKELTTINENVPVPLTRPEQRQKMKTPIITDQEGSGSGSLRDMVKQRKNEFMASYKTKKQIHYDALKQQQKEENAFKYLPIKDGTMPVIKERKPSAYTAGYYSVPHTMNRKFSPTEYAYPQSNLPPTPEGPEGETTNSSGHVVYSTTKTVANLFQTKKDIHKPLASSTVTTTTASSSTSMFCMSSDVSVPMGSNNVSSTPTTTHHYDDVAAAVAGAAGVAIQTSDSILCTQPILGHQLQPYFHSKRSGRAPIQPTISKAAAIQVKPKGIAYVIEFDNKKYNEENSSVPVKVVKHSSNESVVTFTTNNINQLEKLSSEPQLTLQEHLEKAKPNFLKQSKERKAILNQLQAMRQERDRQLRDIIENTSFNSLERRLKYLPPPPIQKLRIVKTKEMKALTNKRVASLPEVVARKQQEQEEKRRRGNRILRDVFNLRLQKRVRNGKLSLNHSKAVI